MMPKKLPGATPSDPPDDDNDDRFDPSRVFSLGDLLECGAPSSDRFDRRRVTSVAEDPPPRSDGAA